MTSITIPNGVTSIGNYTFKNCSGLTSITIPNGVTSIGNYTFLGCSGLTSITIPNGVTSIGNYTFQGCSGLTSITIPYGVTSIGEWAFSDCSSLTSVTIPNSVKYIFECAFRACSALTSVTIPNGITAIDDGSFRYCSSLTSVTIPKSVKYISSDAFYACEYLTDIYCFAREVPKANDLSLSSYENVTLHVPAECKEKYAAVEPWNLFKTIVEMPAESESYAEVTLAIKEENGLIRLQFNSVPRDICYRITRTDANGTNAYFEDKVSHYPNNVEYVDIPSAAGTYTYSLSMAYYDNDGEKQVVESNTVTVTVAEPLDEEEMEKDYGYVIGKIEYDKNPPVGGVKVNFSDGVSVNVKGAHFMRQKVVVGTKLDITVSGDNSHEYESVTITVTDGPNVVNLKAHSNETYTPNDGEFDLAICSDVSITLENGAHHAKFTVKNLSLDNKWYGYIDMQLVKDNHLNIINYLTGNKPTYKRQSTWFELQPDQSKVLDVELGINMDEDTRVLVYFQSTAINSDSQDIIETKEIAIGKDSGISGFPLEKMLVKNKMEEWTAETKEDFAYLMLGVSSVTPGMDGMVGDLTPYKEKVLLVTKTKDALKVIIDWLEGKTAMEAINDPNFLSITSAIKGVFDDLKSSYTTSSIQKYWKNIVGQVADVADADLMLDGIKNLNTMISEDTSTSDGTLKVGLSCASMLYQLASLGNAVPLTQMMLSYQVVGESLVNAAKKFGPIMNSRYILGRLKANGAYTGDEKDQVNTTTEFKIVINRVTSILGRTVPIDFTNKDAQRQIKSISIKAAYNERQTPAEFTFYPVYKKDCIMLQSDGRGITNGTFLDELNEIRVLYMEINWENGRRTLIPLQQESTGVSFNKNNTPIVTDHFEDYKPLDYTVTLTTASGEDHIADELYLGSNKSRQ